MGDFIHRPYKQGETVAALATPVGEGGIAIIRISGDQAVEVADRVFSKDVSSFASHTVHHGYVMDGAQRVDEALLIVMRAPRSYTGEDTVEIQCHGGRVAATAVLETVLKYARLASPGEFTFKAFMNGKMDLAQAEAVQELIAAQSERGFSLAQTHLEGGLSKLIASFQKELLQIAAILEAWVDFPEEGLEFATKEELLADLSALCQKMRHLADTFDEGQKLSHGISVALVGAPNAGKSSLMNALLRKERAIVTEIPGTTRDLIQEELVIDGVLFHLTDTAGIRETEEVVEKEGIRRSQEAIEKSDLVILVMDREAPIDCTPDIIVWNKCDLNPKAPVGALALSAKTGENITLLKKQMVEKVISGKLAPRDVVLTQKRHLTALQEAIYACESLQKGLREDLSPEFLNAREPLHHLGCIIGHDVSEDILSAIFSTFCVGK